MKPALPPTAPTPALEPLAWARAGIGALTLLRTTPILAPLHIWFLNDTAPLLGWPASGGHGALLVAAACVLRTAGATLLMLGIGTRAAGLVAGLAGYGVMVRDPLGYVFTLHLLYQAAILLALVDSATAFALRRRAARSPVSSVWLMRAWVASIYLWAGLSKVRTDWLDGRTLALLHAEGTLPGRLADELLATDARRAAAASLVVVTELLLGPALLWPRTRRWALGLAFAFHALLEIVAHPDLLGWGMMVLLLCFLDQTSDHEPSGAQRMASAG